MFKNWDELHSFIMGLSNIDIEKMRANGKKFMEIESEMHQNNFKRNAYVDTNLETNRGIFMTKTNGLIPTETETIFNDRDKNPNPKIQISGNDPNQVYLLKFNRNTKSFAYDSFRFVHVRGNGNCFYNSIAWWIINYYTFDNSIFGTTFNQLLKNQYVKNPYINGNGDKTVENVLSLLCDEHIYDSVGNLILKLTTNNNEDNKILYCTKLALYLRQLVCGFFDLEIKNPEHQQEHQREQQNIINTLLDVILGEPMEVIHELCIDEAVTIGFEIFCICYIFQINAVIMYQDIARTGSRAHQPGYLTFYKDRPTIYLLFQPGHWSVLYPSNPLLQSTIYPLPVAENKEYIEYLDESSLKRLQMNILPSNGNLSNNTVKITNHETLKTAALNKLLDLDKQTQITGIEVSALAIKDKDDILNLYNFNSEYDGVHSLEIVEQMIALATSELQSAEEIKEQINYLERFIKDNRLPRKPPPH
jgi:hypothetical protein